MDKYLHSMWFLLEIVCCKKTGDFDMPIPKFYKKRSNGNTFLCIQNIQKVFCRHGLSFQLDTLSKISILHCPFM